MNNYVNGKIKDLLKIKHGRSQHKIECANGIYPILATGGIIGRTNNFLWDKPSVLIGRKGTIDKPIYMDTPFWTVDTLFYSDIKTGFVPKYVYYLFKTINWSRYDESTGVPSLSAKTIENIDILYTVDHNTQNRIVSILDCWARAVELQENKIKKLEEKKKALMQKLLKISGMKKSIQELIDEKFCRLIKPKELDKFDGTKTYLSTSSIVNDEIVSNEGEITFNDRPSRAQMKPLANSVWFAKMQNSIKVYKFNKEEENKYILSTGFYGFLTNESVLYSEYLKQLFLSYDFNAQKDIFAEGSSQNGIKDDHLSDILVNIPTIEQQNKISNLLKSYDSGIIKEKSLLNSIKVQQKGLMQKLLTGKVRVNG